MRLRRRTLLKTVAPAALAVATTAKGAPVSSGAPGAVQPFPLEAVRLLPSDYLAAVQANRTYLFRIEPDRLLHNVREQGGLPPKGAVYGGWENDSIAGHTLGHYLSALSLLHGQTGDAEACERVGYIVSELALCQGGDGYIGALTYKAGGVQRPGREMFEAVKAGRIHATAFDLNGAWSPLYVVHKLMAGLLDADRYCGNAQALQVAERLGGYVVGVFAPLDDAQTQAVLACEYGGLNESYAELYARTGNARWLAMARTLYDRKVLDPLAEGRDDLSGLHANTQIPKLIGLARLHQLTGDARAATASRTFWTAVTQRYSYVIGGDADRESFPPPNTLSTHITDQTCESCNSYNMLKLTRLLYQQSPDARYFDVFERAHLNHILAQQNPRTGMFAYMSPLMSGSARAWSTPFDDFWCCMGTGMESHAKHGDSIWWRAGTDTLYVNLFIPSELTWTQDGSRFRLTTDYPRSGEVTVEAVSRTRAAPLTLAVRRPAWAADATLAVNGEPVAASGDIEGYLRVRRRWRTGDRLTLSLPLRLRVEATSDDPDTVAFLHGPLVLAADLGPAGDGPYAGPAPVLVADDAAATLRLTDAATASYRIEAAARPEPLVLHPFAGQHDRRTAVYFKRYSEAGWAEAQRAHQAEATAQAALDARSVDRVQLGDDASEAAHAFTSENANAVVYRGRPGRDARTGGFLQVRVAIPPAGGVLRATYWGEETRRAFRILVDGVVIARESLIGDHPGVFFDRIYPLPTHAPGRVDALIRFEPDPDHTAGPVFGLRILASGVDGMRVA